MVLSRFWLIIFISSVLFVFAGLFLSQTYSIDFVLNGKKDSPILTGEKYLNSYPKAFQDTLKSAPEGTLVYNVNPDDVDTTYVLKSTTVQVFQGKQKADGLLETCKSSLFDLILPLMAYLAFFCGIMQLLIDSGATERLARKLSPFFVKVFPSVPKNHESISYMTLNFSANFLGLDSAATPFGLKAMQSLQEINPDKERASDAQIMFLCLHAAGLTLIPTSIIGYRAAANASNPADVMLPCIVTSLIGTMAAFFIVGFRQRIQFRSATLLLALTSIIGVAIFPYVLGMLAAISLFRNSGLFEIMSNWIATGFHFIGVSKEITDSLPVALLRPFSSSGSRGFMLDAMNNFGPDSLAGRLSSIFQCSAETTFYVVAVYFGSINVRNTRYALGTMLLVDLICVITAIFVALWFF